MTVSNKERFLGICHFERPGDLFLMSPLVNDFWVETPQAWVRQGAPEEIADSHGRRSYFGFDHMRQMREIHTGLYMDRRLDVGTGTYVYSVPPIVPLYEPKFLDEDSHTVTLINEGGQGVRVFKDDPQKMPMYLDHPVKDRQSWEEYKKRLDPHSAGRWPSDWQEYVQRMQHRDEPVAMDVGSFFGFLREWMGLERLLYMFYDDPVLVEDMMEQVCRLETECIERVVREVKFDFVMFWEDMAFKSGPLISPEMFRKFMMPRYKRITDLLRSHSVDIIFVDSDGNLNELVPLWLECGVNFVWPLEAAASNDAVALRKKYGKSLILGGNIDKRVLLKDKVAIRDEVMSKVPFLLESGGYFPSVDHLVPPDVSFEAYVYLIDTLREVAGTGKQPG